MFKDLPTIIDFNATPGSSISEIFNTGIMLMENTYHCSHPSEVWYPEDWKTELYDCQDYWQYDISGQIIFRSIPVTFKTFLGDSIWFIGKGIENTESIIRLKIT